jgi:GNAT superfamily N-acetyltransferase
MTDAELLALVRASLAHEIRLFGRLSAGARVVERPGVIASIVHATPDRSVFNSLLFDDASALRAHHDALAREYAAAGVLAACELVGAGGLRGLGICAVATLPTQRGKQLAARLLSHALRQARERGVHATTLEATSKGAGVYARLGYRALGTLTMWEHRVPRPGA